MAMARASLAELTSARYPTVLTESGLTGAVEQAARLTGHLGINVVVLAEIHDELIDPDVALAVYFCCVEALQNVAKHAGATMITVELEVVEGELVFAVTDDGAGFDAGSRSRSAACATSRLGSPPWGCAERANGHRRRHQGEWPRASASTGSGRVIGLMPGPACGCAAMPWPCCFVSAVALAGFAAGAVCYRDGLGWTGRPGLLAVVVATVLVAWVAEVVC